MTEYLNPSRNGSRRDDSQMPRGWTVVRILAIALVTSLTVACMAPKSTPTPHAALTVLETEEALLFHNVAWHPGGQYLAASGSYGLSGVDIYGVDPATGRTWMLLHNGGFPTWVPGGKDLAYAGGDGIYTATVGTNETAFFRHGSLASWSSDGKYVAIGDVQNSPHPEGNRMIATVVVVERESRRDRVVYQSPPYGTADIGGLAWSPDSSTLAFSLFRQTDDGRLSHALFTARADGSELRSHADTLLDASQPGWMPGGKWLFFLNGYGDQTHLSFVHVDRGCVVDTDLVGAWSSPAISPDGTRLALICSKSICLVNLRRLLGPNNEALTCNGAPIGTGTP